jgi:uncharacterized repeat protein (TIGR03803 family)
MAIAGFCASALLLAAMGGTALANSAVPSLAKPSHTETVLHAFGGSDGKYAAAGLLEGKKGALFGTTSSGGNGCCGTVYELTPDGLGDYTETVLYSFTAGSDGGAPSGVIADDTGALYGTGLIGGAAGAGVVYRLTPNGSGYDESAIYSFAGGSDGSEPDATLIADANGNLYGTTLDGGGTCSCGVVFELTPGKSGYAQKVLYTFQGGSDGANPSSELLLGANGVIFGTTDYGGPASVGTVFKLKPTKNGYVEKVLYAFKGGADGEFVASGLVADAAGALYGTTLQGGAYNRGVVYKLVPGTQSTESVIYDFRSGRDGAYPEGTPLLDSRGNFYGATQGGGMNNCSGLEGCGAVYELKLLTSGDYKERVLYRFAGPPDGAVALAHLVFGKNHTLYGTTDFGGNLNCDVDDGGCGTVFSLTR